jgi:hypothetical protein
MRHPSRRRSRGVTRSRLRRRSRVTQRAGSAGSAPRVRANVRRARGAQGSAARQPASLACHPRPCVRTMCTLVHTTEARVVAISRRSRTARCDARVRAAERLFLCARSSASRQLREVGSTHGRRARSRTHRPSRRRSRGVTHRRLRRRSLFSPRAGSAPRVRINVLRSRGALGSAARQQASHAARLPAWAMCTHHVYARTRSTAWSP